MTMTTLRSLPLGSPQSVIVHAARQAQRGRKPSMSFMGERNPAKALKLAHTELAKEAARQLAEREELVRKELIAAQRKAARREAARNQPRVGNKFVKRTAAVA